MSARQSTAPAPDCASEKIAQVVRTIETSGGSAEPITVDVTREANVVRVFDRAFSPGAGLAYWQLHRQARSAWTQELDLRPFKEASEAPLAIRKRSVCNLHAPSWYAWTGEEKQVRGGSCSWRGSSSKYRLRKPILRI
jgi:hypothetical protein